MPLTRPLAEHVAEGGGHPPMWMTQKVPGRLASASTMPPCQAKCETPTPICMQAQQGRPRAAEAGLPLAQSLSEVGQGWGGEGPEPCDTLPLGSCAREQLQQRQLFLSNWPTDLKADSLVLSFSMYSFSHPSTKLFHSLPRRPGYVPKSPPPQRLSLT